MSLENQLKSAEEFFKKMPEDLRRRFAVILATFCIGTTMFGWFAHKEVSGERNKDLVESGAYYMRKDAILKSEHESIVGKIEQDRDTKCLRIEDMPLEVQGNPQSCLDNIRKLIGTPFIIKNNIHASFALVATVQAQLQIINLNFQANSAEGHILKRNVHNLISIMISPCTSKTYSINDLLQCIREFQQQWRLQENDGRIGPETWRAICHVYSTILLHPEDWQQRIREEVKNVLFNQENSYPLTNEPLAA